MALSVVSFSSMCTKRHPVTSFLVEYLFLKMKRAGDWFRPIDNCAFSEKLKQNRSGR